MNPASPPFEPPQLDNRLADFLTDYSPELFSARLYESIELMERYSIELAIDILHRLEIFPELEQWRTSVELCDHRSFQPRFHIALNWLLRRLIETGCVQSRGDGVNCAYQLRKRPWEINLAALRELGLQLDEANAPTLDLLDYAASMYPAVAMGHKSGEEALFDPHGVTLWLKYFDNVNYTYSINNWVGAVAATELLKSKSKFCILEIGAGAGSGTDVLLQSLAQAELLPRLERYVATEPNAFFRRRSQRQLTTRYPELPLEWNELDMNEAWESQGVSPGEFDLIYGVNVLHVARDLLFSLRAARVSLSDGGWLVIGECVRPFARQPVYAELIFQILDSFTQVNTNLQFRPNPGFLTAGEWERAFIAAGFNRVLIKPDLQAIRKIYPHFFTGAICGHK